MIDGKISLLFLSWRDIRSPKSGGAEVHTHGLLSHLDSTKYQVVHFSPLYEGMELYEKIDGVDYYRRGNVFSVVWYARRYYQEHKCDIDYVVDQCNTHHFFTGLWVKKEKRIFYIHQLTREIWDINMGFPVGMIMRHLETPMLRLQRNDYVITVSESTKQDLLDVGFHSDRIFIIPNAIPFDLLGLQIDDEIMGKHHDFIYVGRYSKYKGIDAAISAIGLARKKYPDIRLRIVGKKDEDIVDSVIRPLAEQYGLSIGDDDNGDNDIVLLGYVSERVKHELMSRSLALVFPSIREGWGIIVSEAAAVGTPSIVYDSPGCRDAVDYGRCGYICNENTTEALAKRMIACIYDRDEYMQIRKAAYDFVQNMTWENNIRRFDDMMDRIRSNG